jgi:hypothetical protein
MNYKARQVVAILLGLTSAVGTVATAILVAKETPKALKKIEKLKSKKDVKKIDYVKALLPVYWPALSVCAGTIASTTISNVISTRTEASLIATSTMLSQGWKKYKGKVQDIFGKDASEFINQEIAKDDYDYSKANNLKVESEEHLYWEENLGFFKCKPLDLMAAIADLNQRLHTPDPSPNGTFYFTTLAVLMRDAKAYVYDKNKLKACENIGWTTDYLFEAYDLKSMWVHANYTTIIKKETAEVLFTKINFFEEQIVLQESEVSRLKYKSREEYEHEAECDMNEGYYDYIHSDIKTADAISMIQESFVNSKIDCDMVDDDGRRFIPSNPDFMESVKYEDGRDYNNPDSETLRDSNLPDVKDIPEL